MVSTQDVLAARRKIDGLIRRTPVIDIVAETRAGQSPITLKLETSKPTKRGSTTPAAET